MSNYKEIMDILSNFFSDNIDRLIGDLSLNDVSNLADDLDNIERRKKDKVL